MLLFSQMTRALDMVEDFLQLRTFKYLRLDGKTKSDARYCTRGSKQNTSSRRTTCLGLSVWLCVAVVHQGLLVLTRSMKPTAVAEACKILLIL